LIEASELNVICSFGITQMKEADLEQWIRRADKALYNVNNSGQNRVVAAQ